MSAEQNKALAGRGIGIWISDDIDVAGEIYAPIDPPRLCGIEAIGLFVREGSPDLHGTTDLRMAEGDMVATHQATSKGAGMARCG